MYPRKNKNSKNGNIRKQRRSKSNNRNQLELYKKGPTDFQNNMSRQRNYRPSVYVNRFSNGLPDEFCVNLVYANQFSVDTVTNQFAFNYEGANPWDPDPQIGGESAREYGFFASAYRYCRTYGSALTADYTIFSGQPVFGVLTPTHDSRGITYTLASSLPRAVKGAAVSLGGITNCRLYNSANTAAILGYPNLDYSLEHTFDLDNGDQGSSVTEPTQFWYWCLYFSSAAGQSGIHVTGSVKIVYKCRFYKKKYLATLQENGDVDDPVDQPVQLAEDNRRADDQ